MKRLIESMQGDKAEEALTAASRADPRPRKIPAEAGISFEPAGARATARVDQSFCACMKSSKPASVKRNQRFASRRQAEKSA